MNTLSQNQVLDCLARLDRVIVRRLSPYCASPRVGFEVFAVAHPMLTLKGLPLGAVLLVRTLMAGLTALGTGHG